MYKIIASLLLSCTAVSTYAQKSAIKGILADSLSKNPLEFATVAVVNAKDTSLISYTLSDKNGSFQLSGLPSDRQAKLIISYVGYKTFRQHLDLTKGETKNFGTILLGGNSLMEVVIKGERSPVVIKKDTIEFNAEAFKTRPNAVVEELLRKFPGVQVNADGSIMVNGKQISKLLIDGKKFFGDDPKVATRNLDADMIDKIQIYDDRENDPDHKLSAMEVGKVINLKMKSKIKKSTLGKFYAGGGSRDRYEAAGILSNFRDTLQVSLIGMGNNLTKTGFSQDELSYMGGFDRSGGQQVWDGTFGGNGWGGMENVASGGVNINNDYGTKLKMNLLYFYNRTNRINNGKGVQEQTLGDTILYGDGTYNSDRVENKHTIGGLVEWNPDTLNKFRYEPKLNLGSNDNLTTGLGNRFNNFSSRVSSSTDNNTEQNTDRSFSQTFFWYRRMKKKGESFSVNHSLNINKNNGDEFSFNNLTSYIGNIRSEVLDRYADRKFKSSSGNVSLNYSFPIVKDLSAELNTNSQYSANTDMLNTFSKDVSSGNYSLFLPGQSNQQDRYIFTQTFKPQLNYQISKDYRAKIGLSAEYQDVKNKFNSSVADINQTYYNFFPSAEFSGPSFSLRYSQRLEQPSINQMQPIARVYSQLYTTVGNPDLKAGRIYQLSGNIYKYNHAKQINFDVYSSLNFSENNIVNKRLVDGNGVTNSTYVNRNGGLRAYMAGNIGKQFKKSQNWQMGLNTGFNANVSKSAFFLNADEGLVYNYSMGVGQSANFNYNELLSINTKYDFNRTITAYKEVDYASINNYTHSLVTEFSLRWPKKVIIDARYNYNYNPQVAQGFSKSSNIVNMALTLQMLRKDRGQLKISVYDLFDQNISVYRFAYENSVNTNDQEILKRYFLLTYQYKFSIHKGK
ncbi:MAG: outer membrane beta-barrel protein [Bacteroidota bacterium]